MFEFKSELDPSIIGKVPKQFLNEDGDYKNADCFGSFNLYKKNYQ